eukprot:TRINITY_DN3455_c0_g3_i1.p1 TRINITY_DN3455_c0_g3~~TRINITY_DN3455_c0_g3_i1.p1  ORF type:complete len:385 (-),score=65.15 TRINITY_DN3455_c0_g3_i1:222-1376(-)
MGDAQSTKTLQGPLLPEPTLAPRERRFKSKSCSRTPTSSNNNASGVGLLLGHLTPAEESLRKMVINLPGRTASAPGSYADADASTSAATAYSEDYGSDNSDEVCTPKPDSAGLGGIPLQITQVNVIIFDWDDTLLPTGFLRDALRMQSTVRRVGQPKMTARSQRYGNVQNGGTGRTSNLPCYDALVSHAELVREALCAARSIAHVGIVTLAERPWVMESAQQYLPGLGLSQLLAELGIPVYYASEYRRCAKSPCKSPSAFDPPPAICKRMAMEDYLATLGLTSSNVRLNLLSIGDSMAEREAARLAISAVEQMALTRRTPLPVCKTVKLQTDPSLKMLSFELKTLLSRLGRMVALSKDVDLIFESNDDADTIEAKAVWAFGACL